MKALIGAACMALVMLSPAHAQLKIVYGNNAGGGPDIVEKFDIDTGAVLQTYAPSGGNGRGVVVVGNVLYSTVVDDPNIYMTDATTGAPLGSILTDQASMSTLAWDGSTFWTTDYSGTNQGFQINTSGTTIKTISFSESTNYMDGMEYFNGKLIVNQYDGGFGGSNPYSIYDLDGNLLTMDFLSAPDGTGIAYDGVNFLVSDVFGNAINIYDGTTGAFIETRLLDTSGGAHLIEDLSVNYAERPDTGCHLDFETEDDFATPLVNGQDIAFPDEFGTLVTIMSSGPNAGAAIFDSTLLGPNDPSQDRDLLVNCGNILMMQTNDNTTQTVPGIFDRPNDDEDGGTLSFAFTLPVAPRSVDLIDIDSGADEAGSVTLTDSNGKTRTYSVPPAWTGDRLVDGTSGKRTLGLMTLDPQPGFQSTVTAAENPGFDGASVVSIAIRLGSSGGVDNLDWCQSQMPRASATMRNGSGVNPQTLTSVTPPVLAGNWAVDLDCSAHASGLAFLLVYKSPRSGPTLSIGEILVGGVRLFRSVHSHFGSVVPFTTAVPNNFALLGLRAYSQGLCTGSPGSQLSNALDIVLGL